MLNLSSFRIKKTIVRFQSLQEMLSSEQGRAVTRKYLNVARSMREYEEQVTHNALKIQLYHQWCLSVDSVSLLNLKCQILVVEHVRKNNLIDDIKPPTAESAEAFPANERIKVNFRPDLSAIIKESRYLDRMGFSIPEAALNIALQVLTFIYF